MGETLCFFVMPFRPELNYFYLYLKRYLEDKYRVRVERGDSKILTKELIRKISEQISEASFLIADTTGANANVFFELGIAYEKNKPVIFITQDDPKNAPVDARHFELIEYQLDQHQSFLARLDNAVRHVLGSSLDIGMLYDAARDFLKQFNAETGVMHAQVSREEFHSRIVWAAAEDRKMPRIDDKLRLGSFLLPKILQDTTDSIVMERVTVWLGQRGPG